MKSTIMQEWDEKGFGLWPHTFYCLKIGVKSTLFYNPLIPRFTTLWDTSQTLFFFNLSHSMKEFAEENDLNI